MRQGIMICGLNGAGKSTLGKALAKKLHFYFIDSEDLYFPKTGQYDRPRTRKEVQKLLLYKMQAHPDFVFASVKGDYGEKAVSFFGLVVWIDVPKDIRIQRVWNRSFQKFGNRMQAGGDLYEQEKQFLDLVKSREECGIEEWIQGLKCPVIKIDGIKPIGENRDLIIRQLQTVKKGKFLGR